MVTQHQLDNGLTILLKEVHSAPVVSSWLAYQVGSRNERPGQTGISHWVEHMMFKGTPRYPAGRLDQLIDRIGGQWNAFTANDYTMYFETLPAEHIDLALDAEADRMSNALFEHDEVESERTVIISERQGSENSPMFWLREAIRAEAFQNHSYHHSILGDMTDLQTITRDALYAHYQLYYTPANAILIIVGDFETQAMLDKVNHYFGDIPRAYRPSQPIPQEPTQTAERRVTVERPGNTAFLMMAHKAPPATHPDWFKLDMLNSILTGPGGNADNKTSRLYRALVRESVSINVGGGLNESVDPYLYAIVTTLRDGRTLQQAEETLLHAINHICVEGITQQELDRARKQARAAFAFETESVTNQAYWLAQSAVLGNIHWYDSYIDHIQAITIEDIQAIAQRYLAPHNRITGWLNPIPVEVPV